MPEFILGDRCDPIMSHPGYPLEFETPERPKGRDGEPR